MSETAEAPESDVAADPPPKARPAKGKPEKRHILLRLFGISIWGALKLTLLCVLVGVIVLAAQFDPRDPQVDVGQTLAATAQTAWNGASWAVRNLWRPALAGAAVVLPIWVLWRLASLPFRK
ncbi:MAG: hypothetical protein AAFX03_10240 [Pseudomonadota bacterium]